jgi:hypothetical protein
MDPMAVRKLSPSASPSPREKLRLSLNYTDLMAARKLSLSDSQSQRGSQRPSLNSMARMDARRLNPLASRSLRGRLPLKLRLRSSGENAGLTPMPTVKEEVVE